LALLVGHAAAAGRRRVLHQRSPRGYRLAEEKRLVVVNTMIRLPNVIFSGGAVGKAPRESRSGLHILEEDMYNLLSESV
jgi:hypothetical protein